MVKREEKTKLKTVTKHLFRKRSFRRENGTI